MDWGKEDEGRCSSSMNMFKCMQLFITIAWLLLEGMWENFSGLIKGSLRYATGVAGESGFGSKATAEQVSQIILSSVATKLTVIATGTIYIFTVFFMSVSHDGLIKILDCDCVCK